MGKGLVSRRVKVSGFDQALELFWEKGWTDGLPVVPPTEKRVRDFLQYVQLDPDYIVGRVPERLKAISAEKLAINAVMAGCLPEYMPLLVAAVEAMCAEDFHFNFLASIGSPWALTIVSGPIVKDLGFNTGAYFMGPGNRASATIGRALSLLLWNCLEARPGGILRGQMGHPCRYSFCIADDGDTPWGPLHVERGLPKDSSAVTVFGAMFPRQHRVGGKTIQSVLNTLVDAISTDSFIRGSYVIILNHHYAQVFREAGWGRAQIADYLIVNCGRTIAQLKFRGEKWGRGGLFMGKPFEIEPGDEHKFVPLFRSSEYDEIICQTGELARKTEILVVVGGGEMGQWMGFVPPYPISNDPVSREIILPGR